MSEHAIAPNDMAAVHNILTTDFTDRYLERAHIGALAFSTPYDPSNPVCDYQNTWWPAKPNRLSTSAGKLVLGKLHRLSSREIDDICVSQFVEQADDIEETLQESPLMLVNGHSPDLQAALSLLACSRGMALASYDNYQETLEDLIKISHGVATRGVAPIMIGNPKLPKNIPFLRLAQLVVSPHFSFPINKQMIASGIPQQFRHDYNARLKAQSIEVAQAPSQHPLGYNSLWAMSPGGTPDIPGEGEHEGKMLTKRIEPATIKLIRDMGCALLPVYTTFGMGKRPTNMELGRIIPPHEYTDATLPTMMADLAEYRRNNGEQNIYYEDSVTT